MTDRTHPDSGRITGGIVEMLHARIADLEAQLEAIGAGGVTGPLVGQPQAMPDLSQLTERGAVAWAGVDAQELREGFTAADMATAAAQGFRDGVASLAASAGSEAVACNRFAWGRLYDKASILMAVIGRDGEVSSRADEVALLMHALHDVDGGEHMPGLMPAAKLITPAPPVVDTSPGSPNFEGGAAYEAYMAADTHPSPPEGMVGGWMPIETAPKDGTEILGYTEEVGALVLYWDSMTGEMDHWSDGMSVSFWKPSHWMPVPLPPTTPAGSGKGE